MTRFYPALIVDGVAFLATTYGRPEIPGVQAHTMGSGQERLLPRRGLAKASNRCVSLISGSAARAGGVKSQAIRPV